MKPGMIAIVGLGLMGGSLAAACRRKFSGARVIGISRSTEALRAARKNKWVHEATRDFAAGVRHADIVVLCTPVSTFPDLMARLERICRPGTLVTDVGSVKGAVLRWVKRKKLKRIRFVGAHPMVGSHLRSIRAANPGLYESGYTFLVRAGSDRAAYRSVKAFWKRLSGRVIELKSGDAHDRIVGEISHLPHLAAVCLMFAVPRKNLKFAAKGFLDATRVAVGHPSIWLPILEANRKEILRSLRAYEQILRRFRRALGQKNSAGAQGMLKNAARLRSQISF